MQKTPLKNHNIIFPTPLGEGVILYHEKPFAIVKILLPRKSRKELMKAIAEEGSFSPNHKIAYAHPQAVAFSDTISDYFKGMLQCNIRIPLSWMDMRNFSELEKAILMATADIPYGSVRTYKEIAQSVGHPGAARFVGKTVAKNPYPILIPCHRIVRSDGTVGNFGGGTDMKEWLIALESSS